MILREAIEEAGCSTLCVSLSSNPGTFGETVHNAGYEALGLNFKYIACSETDIGTAMALVRKHFVRGASISMPFKIAVIGHMDHLDDSVTNTGAVNTVENNEGILTGYNTDVYGFSVLAQEAKLNPKDKISILGAGGVVGAILVALEKFENVTIYVRDEPKAWPIGQRFKRPVKSIHELPHDCGVLINCTPIGMQGEANPFVDLTRVHKYIDLVVKETATARHAKLMEIPCWTGETMALAQACQQFDIYTKYYPPVEAMKAALNARKA